MHRNHARQPAPVARWPALVGTLVLVALGGCSSRGAPTATPLQAAFAVTDLGTFDQPWAMAFLPDGDLLVTEKPGKLRLRKADGRVLEVTGVPEVEYAGQGGLGDVIVHPDFAEHGRIYLSYAEVDPADDDHAGAAVLQARLDLSDPDAPTLVDGTVIWRQTPKVSGRGHYGHRLALDGQGYLWISSGERQKFDPAQDLSGNLGKLLRLHEDGRIPADNPFAAQGGVAAQVWSLGHRNPLGLAFDGQGQLWLHEMGPAHGDELNRIQRGANYGYPIVSNGDHYDGTEIPDHDTRPEFAAPLLWWKPSIAPAGLVIYQGTLFPQFQGQFFIGGLVSRALIRVQLQPDGSAREAERYATGARIREVEQAPDGSLWILEDGDDGRLRRLAPRSGS